MAQALAQRAVEVASVSVAAMPQREALVAVPLPAEVAEALLRFIKEERPGSFTLNFGEGGDLRAWDERRTGRVRDRRDGERRRAGQ